MMKDQYCVILWNDDKHPHDEVVRLLSDLTGRSLDDAKAVEKMVEIGRDVVDINSNVARLL
jgi:E3 ubiquitin-protein ligase UBR1